MVSDNPNFFDNGASMLNEQTHSSKKYNSKEKSKFKKKKVKFTDSYFISNLESMEDKGEVSIKHMVRLKDKTYFMSPYLQSKMIRENIRQVYKIGKCIGTGKFGSVRVASPYSNLNQKFAIKSVPRAINADYIRQLEKEFRILKEVDHPNIIKFFETYQDQKYFHFVLEHWEGGELFDMISKKGKLYESDSWVRDGSSKITVVNIIKKLWSAVAYLHDRDICHRDLKPENIMLIGKDSELDIKLIDFGLSTFTMKGRTMKTLVGTPYYVAPEVLTGSYQKSCDMWSIGVIAYVLLWGYLPFYAETNEEIFAKIHKSRVSYPLKEWRSVSDHAIDFINKLLVKNPDNRMSPREALKHPWLNKDYVAQLDCKVIQRLKQFQAPRHLKSEFMLLMSNFIKDEEINKIHETFEAIDVDYSGWISLDELRKALSGLDDSTQVEQIMANIDLDKNGEISYSEFLAATFDMTYFDTIENVVKMFNHFDISQKGVINGKFLFNMTSFP